MAHLYEKTLGDKAQHDKQLIGLWVSPIVCPIFMPFELALIDKWDYQMTKEEKQGQNSEHTSIEICR